MSDNFIVAAPVAGTMLHNIILACMIEVAQRDGVDEEFDKLRELVEQVADTNLANTLDLQFANAYHAFAELMFMWGWQLRANPDLLAQLQGME